MILSAPIRALALLAGQVAARMETARNREDLRSLLADLHAEWEGGRMATEEFDRREAEILALLLQEERAMVRPGRRRGPST